MLTAALPDKIFVHFHFTDKARKKQNNLEILELEPVKDELLEVPSPYSPLLVHIVPLLDSLGKL